MQWQRKARKQVAKITDKTTRIDIEEAISTLSDLPTAKNVKALTNHKYGYRLRVGNYRVLFDAQNDIQIIDIQEVKKRDGNTY
ncbi:MAG: type II toxin-antitoxin system RelE/ParE family toxin [Moraxellaceae bacterium]|nr:type II toxin-antitoxin system RelE/ParE family toxin [Moraxellaceae bacterium]